MSLGFVLNRDGVLSARGFAKEIGKSINTVFKGIDDGYFQPQMYGESKVGGKRKKIYGFREEYAAEVKKMLPEQTINGLPLFSPSVIAELKKINKRWLGKRVKW